MSLRADTLCVTPLKICGFGMDQYTPVHFESFNGVDEIISRYKKRCPQEEERTTKEGPSGFHTCNELLQSVERLDEEGNDVSVTDLTGLEEELTAAIKHTRARKTELMMERLSTLREQEKKLNEENEHLKQQVAAANGRNDVDDAGGDGIQKHQMKQQDDRGSAHEHGEAASTLQTWNNAPISGENTRNCNRKHVEEINQTTMKQTTQSSAKIVEPIQ
ncbi:hypothetical protein L2E82_24778 [Cichorium intybus]|uniref:Uncharacterized protein n=1 Tax=Cichorium intybus TaxID=13427 RepID=A0ACB9E2S7_CICIN|nr:hypothetical protein L2E82_24778 [Cichorium intybus]